MNSFRVASIRFGILRILLASVGAWLSPDVLHANQPDEPPSSTTPEFEPEARGFVYFGGLVAGAPTKRSTLADEMLRPKDATWVTCVAYSPDGRTLAVGDGPSEPYCRFPPTPRVNENGGLIRILDTRTNRTLRILGPKKSPGHEYRIWHVEFSSDGKTLFSSGQDFTYINRKYVRFSNLTAWDPATGRVRMDVPRPEAGFSSGEAISPDGRWMAATRKNGTVQVWDVATRQERMALRPAGRAGKDDWTLRLAFSPDGNVLVLGAVNGDLWFWETSTGRELARFAGHEQDGHPFRISELAFQADGRTLASLNLLEDPENEQKSRSEIVLYDFRAPREITRIAAEKGTHFCALASSPDGKALAFGCTSPSDREEEPSGWIRLFDKRTLRTRDIGKMELEYPLTLRYSPDGKVLAATDGSHRPGEFVSLFEVRTGRKLADLHSPSLVYSLDCAFSPDGRTLASTGFLLKLWDLRTIDTR